MNSNQIENNVATLIKNFSKDTFIYDLLLAYGLPKATITRLQKGASNLSKVEGEVSLKKKLFFKEVYDKDLHLSVTELAEDLKHGQRFVIVTDYKTLLAKDTLIDKFLDIQIRDLTKNYDFFLPWAGMEKAQLQNENPADIKAAVRMAKLFEEIKSDNENDSKEFLKELNVFLSRLLFCFFAEDADIFNENQLTNGIASHTQTDGSDLSDYFKKVFQVLNTPENQRGGLPEYLSSFPYVNGGLFEKASKVPRLSKSTRNLIIEAGNLDWANINPDIFGSMFQAVNHADSRGSLGQHFTSVPNIMKVIEPLFLNDLKEEFENSRGNNRKLSQLLNRLKNIKIFDPACGSGNFLIIAYKELRRLEMEIFKEMGSLALSEISLNQFYGIELDDFAHEIAILALWLTKHQMNVEFFKEFGRTNPTLPLKDAGNIVQGNACRLDWEEVCPKKAEDEIYILGNPPYLGWRMQDDIQKSDLKYVLSPYLKTTKVDYITCWFIKASEYIKRFNGKYSFVSTNSISQGEQALMLWDQILSVELEIDFAYKSFKWQNNAKGNAGVIVVIIGIRNKGSKPKFIFSKQNKILAKNINNYLVDSANISISKRSKALSFRFKMQLGNMPLDGGNLILSENEYETFLRQHPESKKLIKRVYGANEFLNGLVRFCLWIKNENLEEALNIPEIKNRIGLVKEKRLSGNDKGSIKLAEKPHQFREMKEGDKSALIVPTVTSSRRKYIPIGFTNKDAVIIAPNQAIYDSDIFILSVLSSKMHMTWMKTFAGRLKSDYRYSSTLVYNTFPFPTISNQRKEELTQCTLRIIDERLKYSEKTLAQLYDPDKMPEGLKEAHHQNDLAVERCYRSNPFNGDEERLEYLFKLYETMIQEEKESGTLFAKEKKTRKRK
jgi:type II restriction/modification system DNA methylase subunit YeeA